MNVRIFTVLLVSAVLQSCSTGAPREARLSDDDIIMERLHRVENARVGMAYIDPAADFSRYTKVMLDPLDFSDTQIVQPGRSTSAVTRGPTVLTDRNIDNMQRAFAEVFTRELQETGDYTVVSEPGADVLRVAAAVTQIAPSAPGDDPRSRTSGRVRVYTEGAGSMTITFGFIDSESNEILAVVKDRRYGSPNWGVNNSVTNLSDVRLVFSRWARMLRARLDIAHGY